MECPAECAGPVLAHLSLLRPEYSFIILEARPCTTRGGRRISSHHAHSAGPGILDRGPLAKERPETWWQASGRFLGALKKAWLAKGRLPGAYGTLLDASWDVLGAEKRRLERLLAAPRGIPRQVSAILGAKRHSKGRPRGSKIECQRRLELAMAKPQNLMNV